MNKYQIVIKGSQPIIVEGNSPRDAFQKKYPNVVITPVKQPNQANICVSLLTGKRQTKNFYKGIVNNKKVEKKVESKVTKTRPKISFSQSTHIRMSDSLKTQILELSTQGLVLLDYDYADITDIAGGSALLVGLQFKYQTKHSKGVLDLGDIPFEYYYDCGDICIDMGDELYILDADNAFSFNKEVPKGYQPVKTKFEWSSFYEELMDACEY